MDSHSNENAQINNNNNNNSVQTLTLSNRKKKEINKLLKVVVRRCAQGFATGICVHVVYALVTSALKKSWSDGLRRAWESVFSKSTFQTATFLGLFPSLYRVALYCVKKRRQVEDGWNYLISGAIAGLSILSLDKNNRQTITFFSLSRAIGAGVPILVARGDLPKIPHTNIAVFSVITGIILYCAAARPDYLSSPSYYRSIMKWANDYTDEMAAAIFRNPGPRFLTCQEVGVHEGSCLKHSLLDVKRGFLSSTKIYLPIHALPVLIYKRKALWNNPIAEVRKLAENMVYSASFLTTMVGVAKLCLCTMRNAHHKPPPTAAIIPLLSGTLGAWVGVLWERQSRQRELALFNIFQGLVIFYTAFKKWTTSKHSFTFPPGFVILFSIASMVLMHAYERQPHFLSSITKATLRFIVGERDVVLNKRKELEETEKKPL